MKSLLLLLPLLLFKPSAVKSQDCDTFKVYNLDFLVTAPSEWKKVKVSNGILTDSSANYVCHYEDLLGVNSVISICFFDNPRTPVSKKESRKLRRACTILSSVVVRWPARIFDFKYLQSNSCPSCLPIKSMVYSIPLNPCQSVNFVLNTETQDQSYTTVLDTFRNLVTRFVRTNNYSLQKFELIDFTISQPIDTIKVGPRILKVVVPYYFSIERFSSAGFGACVISSTDSCAQGFSISIVAKNSTSDMIGNTFYPGAEFNPRDTAILLIKGKFLGAPRNSYVLKTKRKISYSFDSYCVIEVSMLLSNRDPVTVDYCKYILRKYSDQLVGENVNLFNPIKGIKPK